MKAIRFTFVVCSVLTPYLAGAQVVGAPAPGEVIGNPYKPSESEKFVRQATQDGLTEVSLGQLAQAKSTRTDVQQFAATMVKDHSAANSKLAQLADQKHIDTPSKLDSKHAAVVKNFSDKNGAEFDSAYARIMADDHDEAIALFEAASRASDQDLAAFAKQTLPVLQHHKMMAQRLVASVTSGGASGEISADSKRMARR